MPIAYALTTHFVGGNHAPIFAAFGSFALMAMVDFSGRNPARLTAYLGLALTGAVLITIGTLCSGYLLLSTAVAGGVTFLISFAGVINGYFAAARIAAVLLIVLPIMIPAGPSSIDDRLLGWAIACAIAIPSIFLIWREPWARPLRKGCAHACRALADLVESPDDKELLEGAMDTVIRVRQQFFKTPHRPTGATGSAAAVAALIEELGWIVSIFWRPGPSIAELGEEGIAVRQACARVLRDTADQVTRRRGLVSTEEIEERREALIAAFTGRVEAGAGSPEKLREDLDRTFRLRLLSFSIGEAAGIGNVAAGEARAPGVLGERWHRILGKGRSGAAATGHLLVEHADPRSAWLRNSLRGAVGIALAIFVADLFDAQNAFWVVLGTLSVLRSNAVGTEGSAVFALVGTAVGIVIGGLVLIVIGDQTALLWVALPLAVFGAAYAPRALSFAAGQAAFSVLVMVLFNLINPIGLEVGLIRVQDVAIGCGVSLVVGLLIWPRGAKNLIRVCLGEAYEVGSRLVSDRVESAIAGREPDLSDPVRLEAAAAGGRLDVALRQYLEESSSDHVDASSFVALTACSARLMRSAHGFRMMVGMPWYQAPPAGLIPVVNGINGQVREWYSGLAGAIGQSGELPEPEEPDDSFTTEVVAAIEQAGRGNGEIYPALSAAWLVQSLEYLVALEGRVAFHADRLFADTPGERTDLKVGQSTG
jgi:uncharacterized membrane protein YccC